MSSFLEITSKISIALCDNHGIFLGIAEKKCAKYRQCYDVSDYVVNLKRDAIYTHGDMPVLFACPYQIFVKSFNTQKTYKYNLKKMVTMTYFIPKNAKI